MSVIHQILDEHKIVACVGSGGVGKTTSAAALGLEAARRGQRALVITIDPAKRLANSLGVSELCLEPQSLSKETLRSVGLDENIQLDVMMLDLQSAWDSMVTRMAHSEEYASSILTNRFYTALSRDLPGAHEFIACEALYTVSVERDYDLIVLDTPPTANALDFLDAPNRILGFLEHDAVKLFAKSSGAAKRFGLRFLDGASGAAHKLLARFTGSEVLDELSAFLSLMRELYAPVAKRTRGFQELLKSERSCFVVVTVPAFGPMHEATRFLELLEERSLRAKATIVNRVHVEADVDIDDLDPSLHDAAREIFAEHRLDATRDAKCIADFKRAVSDAVPILEVKQRAQDVHSVGRLVELLDDLQ